MVHENGSMERRKSEKIRQGLIDRWINEKSGFYL